MIFLLLFFLLLPSVYGACDLSIAAESTTEDGFDLFFSLSDQPIEYWVEDAFGNILHPKRITKGEQIHIIMKELPFQESWVYAHARLLSGSCKDKIAQMQIQLVQLDEPEKIESFASPQRKLFDMVPWMLMITLLFLSVFLIWRR